MFKIQRQYCILALSMSVLVVICVYTSLAVPHTHLRTIVPRISFEDRVKYERAIAEVYWRHRIWPKQNNLAKPSLREVFPVSQIRAKVENYLRQSNALEASGRPITAQQLQTEINRMVTQSKQPSVLNEIFTALGNDPYVIAETVARPILADRLIHELYKDRFASNATETLHERTDPYKPDILNAAWSPFSHNKEARSFDEWWKQASSSVSFEVAAPSGIYRVQRDQLTNSCANDTWAPTAITNAPAIRFNHTAVWTGTEMIIWGGFGNAGADLASGGRYNPTLDSWTATNSTGAPGARQAHTAVWTGTEMIVWGGCEVVPGLCVAFGNGGRYEPSTDSWTPTNQTNGPVGRFGHTAVWTGTEMIIWGGVFEDDEEGITRLASGGRYNLSSNSWTPTTIAGAPEGRNGHTAIWTGTEMIVWGGFVEDEEERLIIVASGGRYNPSTDSWTATTITNAPQERLGHTAIWTGTEMIIWGGNGTAAGPAPLASGARYNPSSDSWTTTTTTNAPAARTFHTAIWTETEMIVWGGSPPDVWPTGGRYCATQSQITLNPEMRVRKKINPRSLGKITVTLFTDGDFRASDVDLSTVRFGRSGTEAAVLQSKLVDKDDDSDLDLVLQFRTAETEIVCGDTVVVITGQLQSGQNFAASKAIKTVGCP